jgi:PLP dependent protein
MTEEVGSRLAAVLNDIRAAERAAGRAPGSVRLVAVGKRHPADMLRRAWLAGQRDFGENYVQEALSKMAALADLVGLEWHFIGAIQGNKTAEIARRFAWVHTVDRARIAERLSSQRPDTLPPLAVLLQVNISGEASKHGCAPHELPSLVAAVRALPRLALRGLMALPEPTADIAAQRRAFAALARLAGACDPPLPELSMGTTADLHAAIAEGATMVRVGTAVFGPRA